MYLKIGVWTLLFLSGCGMVKRSKEKNVSAFSEQREVSYAQKQQSQTKLNWQRELLKKDSAGIEFMVEIWPSGPFNYSPYKGFEGTAQKIIYFGKSSHVSSGQLNEQLKGLQKSSSQTQRQEKKELKQANKTIHNTMERTNSWKWQLGLLLLTLGIITYIFRNYGNISKWNFWAPKE